MIALAALTAILQRLINPLPCSALHAHMQRVDHDPAHVAWVGDDEYDIESLAILERLSDTMEIPEVAALLQQVFARTFHPSMVPGADDAVWREIAGEIIESDDR